MAGNFGLEKKGFFYHKFIQDCQSYDLQNLGLKIHTFSLELMYFSIQEHVSLGIAPIQDFKVIEYISMPCCKVWVNHCFDTP